MSRVSSTRVDRWEEMFDRDIETLLEGEFPVNTDLQPLRGLVESLRAMARTELSEEFIEFHASESAAIAAATREATISTSKPGVRTSRLAALRPRLATVGTSLALVLGMTGVSWAADGAVPGDWYYGFDRALEAIGIGAGGDAERIQEQQVLMSDEDGSAASFVETESSPVATSPDVTGLERAATAVADAPKGGGVSEIVRATVVEKLQYLNEASKVDGAVVSEMARGDAGRPEQAGAGKPDEPPGRGNANGKTENPGKGHGRP